jgi:hypothetical protein
VIIETLPNDFMDSAQYDQGEPHGAVNGSAHPRRNKSNVIGDWLPSLTFAEGRSTRMAIAGFWDEQQDASNPKKRLKCRGLEAQTELTTKIAKITKTGTIAS